MRRQALWTAIVVMVAAGLVAIILRVFLDVTSPSIWGIQKAYFGVSLGGLVLAGVAMLECVRRRDLRRYVPGFSLIALVMAVRVAALVHPLPLKADVLMVSATLPIGLAGGALVIYEWHRMRTAGTKAG